MVRRSTSQIISLCVGLLHEGSGIASWKNVQPLAQERADTFVKICVTRGFFGRSQHGAVTHRRPLAVLIKAESHGWATRGGLGR
jgi:hypothetical protein